MAAFLLKNDLLESDDALDAMVSPGSRSRVKTAWHAVPFTLGLALERVRGRGAFLFAALSGTILICQEIHEPKNGRSICSALS